MFIRLNLICSFLAVICHNDILFRLVLKIRVYKNHDTWYWYLYTQNILYCESYYGLKIHLYLIRIFFFSLLEVPASQNGYPHSSTSPLPPHSPLSPGGPLAGSVSPHPNAHHSSHINNHIHPSHHQQTQAGVCKCYKKFDFILIITYKFVCYYLSFYNLVNYS